jgi:hypothetical protein
MFSKQYTLFRHLICTEAHSTCTGGGTKTKDGSNPSITILLGKQLTIERYSGEDVQGPKHGKVDADNTPHVGGNTWAGGTGGRDTAGIGTPGLHPPPHMESHDHGHSSRDVCA